MVSADLSHYYTYEEAQAADRETAAKIKEVSPEIGYHQSCGAGGINSALILAQMMRLRPEILSLINSGDTAGSRERVVGYGAWAFAGTGGLERETAALADYALPAATWLERPDNCYAVMNHRPMYFGAQARVIDRFEGGADVDFRDDYEFWYGLAIRLGQEDKWWGPKTEDMLDFQLAPMGMTFEQFYNDVKYMAGKKKYLKYKEPGYKFLTPSGKVELKSSVIEKLAEETGRPFDPLPHFEYPGLSNEKHPEWGDEYPLIAITGARFMPFYHSEHRQPGPYRDLHPEPIFDIHPDTAIDLDIADGDWCWIETHMGRIKQRARKTSIVDPRVISIQHDWWFPEQDMALPNLGGVFKSSVNVILDDDPESLDQLMGSWQQTGVAVKVYKCAPEECGID